MTWQQYSNSKLILSLFAHCALRLCVRIKLKLNPISKYINRCMCQCIDGMTFLSDANSRKYDWLLKGVFILLVFATSKLNPSYFDKNGTFNRKREILVSTFFLAMSVNCAYLPFNALLVSFSKLRRDERCVDFSKKKNNTIGVVDLWARINRLILGRKITWFWWNFFDGFSFGFGAIFYKYLRIAWSYL